VTLQVPIVCSRLRSPTCLKTSGAAGATSPPSSTASSRTGIAISTAPAARRVMIRMEEGRRTPFGLYWDDDLADVLLRYGWPTFWTRDPPTSLMVRSDPHVTGHEASPAFHFAPQAQVLDDPGRAKPGDWSLDGPQSRERYAPAYATAFTYLDHQQAVFRRDDFCLVVAAYDLSSDTLFAQRAVTSALALAWDERTLTL